MNYSTIGEGLLASLRQDLASAQEEESAALEMLSMLVKDKSTYNKFGMDTVLYMQACTLAENATNLRKTLQRQVEQEQHVFQQAYRSQHCC